MRADNEKKTSLSEEDQALFRQLMTGTRKIKQDTIVHRPQRKKITEIAPKRLLQEQVDNSHYFSDEFQPLLNTEGSTKYVRPDVSHFELKSCAVEIIRRSCSSICMGLPSSRPNRSWAR